MARGDTRARLRAVGGARAERHHRVIERWLQRFLRHYASGEAVAVARFLRGDRLLDLGAGEGYLAAALATHTAAWTCSVDVGPFRRAAVPYAMYDGASLPFADGAFDTTLIVLTLHHCADPATVFDEAVRVTRQRLIVVESVYRTRLERFWLERLDPRLNARRHDGGMRAPCAFGTPEAWEALFAARGLTITARVLLGSWWERLVHHPLLFVLDKAAAAERVSPRASEAHRAPLPGARA
jgi:SAM-dependent methyltransferase